jgi:hypothetical protein
VGLVGRLRWTYSFKLRNAVFPGRLGGFGRWLFRVTFVNRDYATLMRSALQRYNENAESLPENVSANILKRAVSLSFSTKKEGKMAIPKNADPDRGPYRSGREQIDDRRIHVVKNRLDPAELNTAIDKVHRAGIPGAFAEVRDSDKVWRGAAGVADVSTGRPVTPDMQHRVGSISKTFTAAAVLQQVETGQIGLDTPIGHYLPRLVPGERGNAITVRMLINHTRGLRNISRMHTRPSSRSRGWRTPRRKAWTTTGSRNFTGLS